MSPSQQQQLDDEFDAAIQERLAVKRQFGQSQQRIERVAKDSINMSREHKEALVTLRGLMEWTNKGKRRG